MSADPVSWLLIEKGWKVVAADGAEVGEVDEVVGDTGEDIFNGLSVATGLLERPTYVPAEAVASITEGRVTLSLARDEIERLPEFHQPPPSLEISSSEASTADRVADAFTDVGTRPQPVTPWRRLLARLFPRR